LVVDPLARQVAAGPHLLLFSFDVRQDRFRLGSGERSGKDLGALWREVDVPEAVLEPEWIELRWITVEAGAAGQSLDGVTGHGQAVP
jgi:hypothetical protein